MTLSSARLRDRGAVIYHRPRTCDSMLGSERLLERFEELRFIFALREQSAAFGPFVPRVDDNRGRTRAARRTMLPRFATQFAERLRRVVDRHGRVRIAEVRRREGAVFR